ncbi:MAG TPA: hypothetical protein VKM55_04730 [Candidatus Lokiarchaeia archaeon]|nr:hypothetical protein [Candidatus Lokiarchaeia archaeon]
MIGDEQEVPVFPGAEESTPSRAQYFSWINNTNEGATEAQTMANLAFFEWLQEEYGMQLDIYAFDAGAIDGPHNTYGRLDSEKFLRQFPRGLDPIYEKAKSLGIRLGVWGGPDGFGDSEEEAQARIDLMVGLCKNYEFALFKFDGVCGTLRKEKQDYFVKMMQECRKYSPDLILLNHRLDFGKGMPYATTFLLGGMETYIDVSFCNAETCIHHRQGSLARELPKLPDGRLTRMTEDHGVCISSFPDAWDDDLVLQTFNRGLILAPELYGNPWFLRDDEYPKLARIFNLARKYRDILVHSFELPPEYGLNPMVHGDGQRRLITLRNNSWEPVIIPVKLDESIGLDSAVSSVIVRRVHPHEYWYGEFQAGDKLDVEIPPFHSFLLLVFDTTIEPFPEVTIKGCEFDIIKEIEGLPVEMKLLGMPGTTATIELLQGTQQFAAASIDGDPVAGMTGDAVEHQARIEFQGTELKEPWHRKLAKLEEVDVPDDVGALYETIAFTVDNSCLEVRCRQRFGETSIPAVRACRDAFFNQDILKARGCWDRYAFDGDDTTIWHMEWDPLNCLRVDFGQAQVFDCIQLIAAGKLMAEPIVAWTSADLKNWHSLAAPGSDEKPIAQPVPDCPDMREKYPRNLDERFAGESRVPTPPQEPRIVELGMPSTPMRYFLMKGTPDDVFDVNTKIDGEWLTANQRTGWHGTFLFENSKDMEFTKAWSSIVTLSEIPPGAKICVACEGRHGGEGIYTVLRINAEIIPAPDRAPAYLGRPWEHLIQNSPANYTYYFPLHDEWINTPIEIICFATEYYEGDCHPEAWLTAWPDPLVMKTLVLERE